MNASIQEASKSIILSHIQQLNPIFEKNSDVICVVNAGFIGTWGEWYYTSQDDFGKPSSPNYENRREVIEALLKALPTSRMIQLRTPFFKRTMYSFSALSDSKAFDKAQLQELGITMTAFWHQIQIMALTWIKILNINIKNKKPNIYLWVVKLVN